AVLPQLLGTGGLTPRPSPSPPDLANWMVGGNKPPTRRGLVNRPGRQDFCGGRVGTGKDFGAQGPPPPHPPMRARLAGGGGRGGWAMKPLHRLIVPAAPYRQSSHARNDLRPLDPRTPLLARQNRIRLEAEVVRDVALATSGFLTTTIGGPGVFPPQPDGVY